MILFRSDSSQGARCPLDILYRLSRGALQLLTFAPHCSSHEFLCLPIVRLVLLSTGGAATYWAVLFAIGSPAINEGLEELRAGFYVDTEPEAERVVSRRLRGSNSKELTAGSCAGACGHLPIRASLAECDRGAAKQTAMQLL
jgi:hypothetical protein